MLCVGYASTGSTVSDLHQFNRKIADATAPAAGHDMFEYAAVSLPSTQKFEAGETLLPPSMKYSPTKSLEVLVVGDSITVRASRHESLCADHCVVLERAYGRCVAVTNAYTAKRF